jgi:hypothetical protein
MPRLRGLERVLDAHGVIHGVARRDREAVGEHDVALATAPQLGERLGDAFAQLARGIETGVAAHERLAAGVAAEVHRRQIGVGGDDAHVAQVESQFLADDGREHGIRALTDVAHAAEHRRTARTIELELHRRLRHLVRIDTVVGARDVGAARDAETAPIGQSTPALAPTGGALDLVEALQEAVRGDTHAVDGARVLTDEVAAPHLDRVHADPLGELVELALEREARLHRAVASLGTAARLVREHARRVEAIGGHRVRRR